MQPEGPSGGSEAQVVAYCQDPGARVSQAAIPVILVVRHLMGLQMNGAEAVHPILKHPISHLVCNLHSMLATQKLECVGSVASAALTKTLSRIQLD